MFLPRCGVRPMPNARQTPGLRLTPETRELLRGMTEAVENGTAPFITHEAVLAARAFREIERLEAARAEAERWKQQYEALRAAVIKAEADYASRADGLDDALMILRQLLAESGGGGDERV